MELLPDSRTREAKTIWRGAVPYEQMFCANCAHKGPLVISPPDDRRFAFYVCQNCAEKHGPPDGTFLVPDSVHAQLMQQEMQEKYGRVLAHHELLDVLGDPHSTLAKLAKEKN